MPLTSIEPYEFLAPPRILFGWGRWREVGPAASALGKRAWLVSGSRTLSASGCTAELGEVLKNHGVESIELATISREPEVADVDAAVALLREIGAGTDDIVVAMGGGSAMDLAKAVAALATNTAGAGIQDYLEGVGRGLKLVHAPLPIVALPTTAGTGSEATKNAVISSCDPPFKKSLRSEQLIPRAVIVDPQLTVSAPPHVTAHSGMDAITQLIESYVSRRAKPIPRALARQGFALALPAIVEAVENGSSRPAREAMSHAALLSGMALANSGLGLAHGVAAALGVHFRVPHGLACAVVLPVALRVNREECLTELVELAAAVGIERPSAEQAVDELLARIEQICRRVGVWRRLSEFGVAKQHLNDLVRDSRGNSMDGNPRALSDEELYAILEAQL